MALKPFGFLIIDANGRPAENAYGDVLLFAEHEDAIRHKSPVESVKKVRKYDRRHNKRGGVDKEKDNK